MEDAFDCSKSPDGETKCKETIQARSEEWMVMLFDAFDSLRLLLSIDAHYN